MSVTNIPISVKCRLWGKAGGRCQYDGCNIPLWFDSLTKEGLNKSYIAHIVADKPNGPRGHSVLSEQLKDDISNLMLMCDEHHRLIDKIDVEGHPVDRLIEMKRKHEERIERLTSIKEEKQSHVLLFGANIGKHSVQLSWDKAANAMVPDFYPAESQAIEIGLKNSSFTDINKHFWDIEMENLNRQFNDKLKSRLEAGGIEHLSIFALAPQPLLMQLGHLLSDIPAANVYQLHREPPDWKWHPDDSISHFHIEVPPSDGLKVALNLSISATIDNKRISNVLGDDISIWTVKPAEDPHNDILKSKNDLELFRLTFRKLMDKIKIAHGQNAELHVFPAVPVSVAVEIGRLRMPKADLPLHIYNQNGKVGFQYALSIE